MRSPPCEKSGALIIRIWIEQTTTLRILARISSTIDLDGGEHSSTVASSTDEIERAVRGWLSSLVKTATEGGYPAGSSENPEKRSCSTAESSPN